MKRTAGAAGSCPPASVARTRVHLHRCILENSAVFRALFVATVVLLPVLVSARDFPADAIPSDTFPGSSQHNASTAALPGDPFSLTLDELHSQGLRRHSRSLKQSSCSDTGTASAVHSSPSPWFLNEATAASHYALMVARACLA